MLNMDIPHVFLIIPQMMDNYVIFSPPPTTDNTAVHIPVPVCTHAHAFL